jgi:hypothetical protein
MNKLVAVAALSAALCTAVTNTEAAIYTFGTSTGVMTLLNSSGVPLQNNSAPYDSDPTWGYGYRTQVEGSVVFDTATGAGSVNIDPFVFFGDAFTFHDLNFQAVGDGVSGPGTLMLLNGLWDWNGFGTDVPFSLVWDGAGLLTAVNSPLTMLIGDKLSGDELLRWDGSTSTWDTVLSTLGSEEPASNGIQAGTMPTGPVPLATTTWNTTTTCSPPSTCIGNSASGWIPLIPDSIGGSPMPTGPFAGYSINLDLGTPGSMVLTSIEASPVPIPAAAWLFGSGLIGLLGVARRKAA